jgi:alpha-beta hydrolase superfamily lysophospholipase
VPKQYVTKGRFSAARHEPKSQERIMSAAKPSHPKLEYSPQGDASVRNPSATELVIFLHGYAARPKDCAGLLEFFGQQGRDVYAPAYPAQPFTSSEPNAIAGRLADVIDTRVTEGRANGQGSYQTVTLCAHSMGCVFLKAAILELVNNEQSRLGQAIRRGSAPNVRMLLLSSTNRGYRTGSSSPTIGYEIAHRWFWFTLLMIACGWWARCIGTPAELSMWLGRIVNVLPQWAPFSSALKSVAASPEQIATISAICACALAGLMILAALLVALFFLLNRAWSWRGSAWLPFAGVWGWWGATGDPRLLHTAVILTPFSTAALGWLFANRCCGIFLTTFASLVVAAIPLVTAADPLWVCPLTLVIAWQAMVSPWTSGLLLENIVFGSAWVTAIRMRWLEAFSQPQTHKIPTVLLFGDRDCLVDDDDHDEMMRDAESDEFALADAYHKDFILTPRTAMLTGRTIEKDRQRHPAIKEFLKQYLDGGDLREFAASPASHPLAMHGQTEPPRWRRLPNAQERAVGRVPQTGFATTAQPAQAAGHVIFLIHGIRDFGEWQDTLANKIREVAASHGQVLHEVVCVRYGYFSAFQFLLWGERNRATRAFLDAYAQARARYPDASFHVAAHSNGTFVVANSLRRPARIRLTNVYFAGSVLWRFFPWSTLHRASRQNDDLGRLQLVRSDLASEDWPVGALCWVLSLANYLRWGLLGTAGVDGFDSAGGFLSETHNLKGGHGEGLRAKRHESIARFLLLNRPTAVPWEANINRWFLWKARIVAIGGALLVVLSFLLAALVAPANPLWNILVGAMLTILVVRIMMAI